MKKLTGWQTFFIVIGVIAVIFIIMNWNKIFGNGSNGNGTANGATRMYRQGGIGGFNPGFTPGTTPVVPVNPSIQPVVATTYDVNQRALTCDELLNACAKEYAYSGSSNGNVCSAWKNRCQVGTSQRTADDIIISRSKSIVIA